MDNSDKTQRLARTAVCPKCGEEYSVTYRRCPFCGGTEGAQPKAEKLQAKTLTIDIQGPGDPKAERSAAKGSVAVAEEVEEFVPDLKIDFTPEIEDEESTIPPPPPGSSGGRRLAKPSRGGGVLRGVLFVLSLLLVAAAVYIVITRVVPLVRQIGGDDPAGQQQQQGGEVDPPVENEPSFTLTEVNVTLTAPGSTKQMVPIYEPVEEIGHLTWSSDNENVVTVSSEGRLTAVSPGSAIITVRRTDGSEAHCRVDCTWTEETLLDNLSLNRDDFTFRSSDAPVQMRVLGVEGAEPQVVWESENPAIASVTEAGVVNWIAVGDTTISATVNGTLRLECVVRCK